jgi:hypothetical protein
MNAVVWDVTLKMEVITFLRNVGSYKSHTA